MNINNIRLKSAILCIVLTVVFFLTGLFTNIIRYGDMVIVDADTDQFSSYSNRELEVVPTDDLIQYLGDNEGKLHSISLKYHPDQFTDTTEVTIQLFDAENQELLQGWTETGQNIQDNWFVEYAVDSDIVTEDMSYYLRVTVNEPTKVLFCSQVDSNQKCPFLINGVEQEGDLILRVTSDIYVTETLFWGFLYCGILAFLITMAISNVRKIRNGLASLIYKVRLNYKKILVFGIEAILLGILSIILERIYTSYHLHLGHEVSFFNPYKLLFIYCCLVVALIMKTWWKTITEKPERAFLFVFMVIGLFLVVLLPAEAEVSWDESIHYWKAVTLANAWDGQANSAQSYLYWHSGIGGYGIPSTVETLHARQYSIQMMYEAGTSETVQISALRSLNALGYLPSAFGLILGKLFSLSLKRSFYLGAGMNLILYMILVYFGMKKLKSGKLTLLVISCLPTAVYLASVYSLDSWITGFSILGMCYLIGTLQSGEKVTNRDLAVMLVSFSLGFLAKAVYFPMFLLFLLIKKDQFVNERQGLYFRITTIALCLTYMLEMVLPAFLLIPLIFIMWGLIYAVYKLICLIPKDKRKTVLVICTLITLVLFVAAIYVILPLLVGSGDARGGNTVNSAEQVKFVLSNPFAYAKILFTYLLTNYLNPMGAFRVTFATFGYLGESQYVYLFMWFVLFVIIFDKSEFDQWSGKMLTTCSVLVVDMVTIILIATALYVSFTPVAYPTINGCQPRYLMPLMFGTGVMIGTNRIPLKMNRSLLTKGVFLVTIALLLLSIWKVVVVKYI